MHLKEWQTQFLIDIKKPCSSGQEIYQSCLLEAKLGSLKKTFPATCTMISDDAFESIGQSFLESQEKIPYDIGKIGSSFPHYLSSHSIADHLPYLPSLSLFELHWHEAFNSPAPHIDQLLLQNKLAMQDDLAILSHCKFMWLNTYNYKVDELWQCCQPEYTGDFSIKTSAEKTTVLLYRENFQVKMVTLDPLLANLFHCFDGKKTLKSIYQTLKDKSDLQKNFDQLFIQLCQLGLLQ